MHFSVMSAFPVFDVWHSQTPRKSGKKQRFSLGSAWDLRLVQNMDTTWAEWLVFGWGLCLLPLQGNHPSKKTLQPNLQVSTLENLWWNLCTPPNKTHLESNNGWAGWPWVPSPSVPSPLRGEWWSGPNGLAVDCGSTNHRDATRTDPSWGPRAKRNVSKVFFFQSQRFLRQIFCHFSSLPTLWGLCFCGIARWKWCPWWASSPLLEVGSVAGSTEKWLFLTRGSSPVGQAFCQRCLCH